MKGNEELQGSQIYVNTANTWFTDFSVPSLVQSSLCIGAVPYMSCPQSFPVSNKCRIFLLFCRMIDHLLDIVTLLCWETQGKFMFRLTHSSRKGRWFCFEHIFSYWRFIHRDKQLASQMFQSDYRECFHSQLSQTFIISFLLLIIFKDLIFSHKRIRLNFDTTANNVRSNFRSYISEILKEDIVVHKILRFPSPFTQSMMIFCKIYTKITWIILTFYSKYGDWAGKKIYLKKT